MSKPSTQDEDDKRNKGVEFTSDGDMNVEIDDSGLTVGTGGLGINAGIFHIDGDGVSIRWSKIT